MTMRSILGLKGNGRITGGIAVCLVVVGCTDLGVDSSRAETDDELAEPVGDPGLDLDPGPGVDRVEFPIEIEDVADNPAGFDGRRVSLSGEVEETFMPGRAFSLSGDGVIAESQLMILVQGSQPVEEGHAVRVVGTVRAYDPTDREQLESDLGWAFDEELELELRDAKAVLVATSISPAS